MMFARRIIAPFFSSTVMQPRGMGTKKTEFVIEKSFDPNASRESEKMRRLLIGLLNLFLSS